jgi:hypothetical protein
VRSAAAYPSPRRRRAQGSGLSSEWLGAQRLHAEVHAIAHRHFRQKPPRLVTQCNAGRRRKQHRSSHARTTKRTRSISRRITTYATFQGCQGMTERLHSCAAYFDSLATLLLLNGDGPPSRMSLVLGAPLHWDRHCDTHVMLLRIAAVALKDPHSVLAAAHCAGFATA